MGGLRSTRDIVGVPDPLQPLSQGAGSWIARSNASFSSTKENMQAFGQMATDIIRANTKQFAQGSQADKPLFASDSNELVNGIQAVIDSINGIGGARVQVAQILARPDPSRSQQYLYDSCAATLKAAGDKCQASIDSLKASAARIAEDLHSDMLPQAPKGVSDAMVLDRKQDLQAAIAGKGEQGWADRLKQALIEGDKLSSYVLSSCLQVWMESQGFNLTTVELLRAQVMGAVSRQDGTPVPGADLYNLLSGGGVGSMAAFLTSGAVVLYAEIQDSQQWLAQLAQLGQGPQGPRGLQPPYMTP